MSPDVTERQWIMEQQTLRQQSSLYTTQNCLCAALEMSTLQMQVILGIITDWITDWISSLLLVPLGHLRAEPGGFICSQIKGHHLPPCVEAGVHVLQLQLEVKVQKNRNKTQFKCIAAQQSHKRALTSPSLMSPNNNWYASSRLACLGLLHVC